MPKQGFVVKFKSYHKQLQVSFVIYADFEALTQKIDRPSCQPAAKKRILFNLIITFLILMQIIYMDGQ